MGKGYWRVSVAKVGKVGLGLMAGHQGHRRHATQRRIPLQCFAVVADWRLRVWPAVPQSALWFLNKPLSGVTLSRVMVCHARRFGVEGGRYSGAGHSRNMACHKWGRPCLWVGRPSVTLRRPAIQRPARAYWGAMACLEMAYHTHHVFRQGEQADRYAMQGQVRHTIEGKTQIR